MARQTLNNGESGLVIRGKINDNFTELYGSVLTFAGTWDDLLSGYPAASHSGKVAVVTDPTYFINPLRVRSDGTKWRLDGDQTLWLDTTPMTGAAGTVTSEQLQKQWTAPAGFLTSLRWFSLKRLDYKTATSDTYTIRMRAGVGATPLSDTLIVPTTTFIASTNRTNTAESFFIASSATQLRRLAQQVGVVGWNGAVSGTTYPQNFTVPDSDVANTAFSCTMQLTTGTDSSASGQAHFFVSGG